MSFVGFIDETETNSSDFTSIIISPLSEKHNNIYQAQSYQKQEVSGSILISIPVNGAANTTQTAFLFSLE